LKKLSELFEKYVKIFFGNADGAVCFSVVLVVACLTVFYYVEYEQLVYLFIFYFLEKDLPDSDRHRSGWRAYFDYLPDCGQLAC
jgi:hypothetical protein